MERRQGGQAERMSRLRPIETFSLPDYAEALFVYRDEMIFGIGYKVGETCDGEPMFKVSGGLENPTHWMPLPKPPSKEDEHP